MPTALKDFESVFPRLAEDIVQHTRRYGLPQHALEWFAKSLNYNTLGGKCNRGLSVPDTVAILKAPGTNTNGTSSGSAASDPQSSDFFPACTLGWMVELLQAFFLVSDDIMDQSHTRRGQPCWFRHREVGNIAINDAFMLESSIYMLLRKHFKSHSDYIEIVELFHEVAMQTECGQLCDLLTAPEDNVDLANFSLDKFEFIVVYKTAYYSFYLPVALALHYCNLATPANLKQAHDILIPMGTYFQAQDDYLDCYADPEVLGKIGTDIQDNKCSWLINQALSRVSQQQREVLDSNYGRKDDKCEQKVKQVYNELKLDDVYLAYEEEQVGKIRELIAHVDESQGLKKEVFEVFLGKIYKRQK